MMEAPADALQQAECVVRAVTCLSLARTAVLHTLHSPGTPPALDLALACLLSAYLAGPLLHPRFIHHGAQRPRRVASLSPLSFYPADSRLLDTEGSLTTTSAK